MSDTGDTGLSECEAKLAEYNTAMDAFDSALADWIVADDEAVAAEEALDDAFGEKEAAKAELTRAQKALAAGNPDQSRIDDINTRLAEIEGYDPDERLDELQPILTGDDLSGDVNDAWMQARFYIDLIQERAELVAELESLSGWSPAQLEQDVIDAEGDVGDAAKEITTAHKEWRDKVGVANQKLQIAADKRSLVMEVYYRYVDYGCVEETGDIDVPEPVET